MVGFEPMQYVRVLLKVFKRGIDQFDWDDGLHKLLIGITYSKYLVSDQRRELKDGAARS